MPEIAVEESGNTTDSSDLQLENRLEVDIFSTVSGIMIDFKPEPLKALESILVTEAGISSSVTEEVLLNAYVPIVFNVSGSFTSESSGQLLKADVPIDSIPDGSFMDFSFDELLNAESPIIFTLEGISNDSISVPAKQPLVSSSIPAGSFIEDIPEPEKAEFPILVTLSGIITDVNLEQP